MLHIDKYFCVLIETSQLLVCHWRSRFLCEPGSGTEDEPMGQVRYKYTYTHPSLKDENNKKKKKKSHFGK